MSKLTETQLLILSRASQRPDGLVEVPLRLTGAARKRVIQPLLKQGHLKEIQAGAHDPVWRRDEALGPFSLVITKSGTDAIGVAPEEKGTGAVSAFIRGRKRPRKVHEGAAVSARRRPPRAKAQTPRPGSKLAAVIALLQRKNGASIENLASSTGWQPHTVRAALTGLRKRGYSVDIRRGKTNRACYHISLGSSEQRKGAASRRMGR